MSCVEELSVVERAVVPKNTCAPETKLFPEIVRVKLPVGRVIGLTVERTGAGFQSVTVLVPVAELSAALTAVIVTDP